MAQLLEIKTRIKSVNSTLKITKAMKMIATARLVKARERLNRVKPVYERLENMTNRLLTLECDKYNDLFMEKDTDKILFVVFSTDRGFCGGYNIKLFNFVEEQKQSFKEKEVHILPIGQKASDFYDKYDHLVKIPEVDNIVFEKDLFNRSRLIVYSLRRMFLEDGYSQICLLFNNFKSLLLQQPKFKQLLPLKHYEDYKSQEYSNIEYLFEPNLEDIFERLLDSYLILSINEALIELETGEYGSRMSAMDGANRNGEKINRKLKIQFQRARQEAITKELTEIIGGAETLRREQDE